MKAARLASAICIIACMALLIFLMMFAKAKAETLTDANVISEETTVSEEVSEDDEYHLVDITVELEDTSRFMGVSVYRIGYYEDGHFFYNTPYREQVNYDYNDVKKENTKEAHVLKLSEFIRDEEIPGDYLISVENGTGKIEGIEPGLFLLIQDEESDYNAQLKKTVLIEGPSYDSVNKEDIYDIRTFPQYEKAVWFTFRPEVAGPMSLGIILLACLMLCVIGTRSVKFVLFMIPFAGVGMAGVVMSEFANFKFIEMMLVYVLVGFIGVGFSFLLMNAFRTLFKNTGVIRFLNRNSFWISTIIGAGLGALVVYKFISQNLIFYAIIPGAVFIFGFIWQLVRRKRIPEFHNYEDLISIPIKKEVKGGEING